MDLLVFIHTVGTVNPCSPCPDTCAERHGTTMAAAVETQKENKKQVKTSYFLSSKMSIINQLYNSCLPKEYRNRLM